MKPLKGIPEYAPEFWEGRKNILIRGWTYLNRGLEIVNQAKYLVAGIIALYAVLHFTNPMWMIVMGIASVPVLIVIGRWHLYKAAKSQEYVTTTKGSVLGYSGYNLQVKILETLEQILKETKND